MDNLCISITYLDPYFHGQGDYGPEWPPSPWRLFQSILATAARNHGLDEQAFKWLEDLDPPVILSPTKVNEKKRIIKMYVPDNSSDRILNRQERLSEKEMRPTMIKEPEIPLHYIWSIESEDIGMASKIADYAKDLTTLGWGIDLVAGNGQLMKNDEVTHLIHTYQGSHQVPSKTIGVSLRCPVKGSYDNLKMVHESKKKRFNGLTYTHPKRPTIFKESGYIEKGIPYRAIACLRLLQPIDEAERWASFDPRYTIRVSSWIRGFLCSIAKKDWQFSEPSDVYVAGHHDPRDDRTPPRFSYLPLPTIGHQHADGLIRRVMIAEPYGDDGSKADWVGSKINTAILKNESGYNIANIERTSKDKTFESYSSSGRLFKTVTPVILPGHDDRKYPKAEKLFLKAIVQAGFDVEDIDYYILQNAPFFKGGYHPREYKVTAHLKGLTAIHVLLKWKCPIYGPLAIGAGRHRGLGLFVPTDDDHLGGEHNGA
jgi:CRISPR-associated protein Csb2